MAPFRNNISTLFKALEQQGITCKENFTCCNTCGCIEIHKHKKQYDFGFCFYHKQDTQSAYEDGSLCLRYNSYNENVGNAAKVGEMICTEAKKQGFCFEWDGCEESAIVLNGVNKQYFKDIAKSDKCIE